MYVVLSWRRHITTMSSSIPQIPRAYATKGSLLGLYKGPEEAHAPAESDVQHMCVLRGLLKEGRKDFTSIMLQHAQSKCLYGLQVGSLLLRHFVCVAQCFSPLHPLTSAKIFHAHSSQSPAAAPEIRQDLRCPTASTSQLIFVSLQFAMSKIPGSY